MRLLGFVATSGGSVFTGTPQNAVNQKGFYLQPAVSVLSGGNATSFTAVDLSTPIPTTTAVNVIAYLSATFIPAAVGDTAMIRPTGSSATTGLVTISGQAAGVSQQQYIQVVCGVSAGVPKIDYKVSSGSDSLTLLVAGYAYNAAIS